jgi:transcriptional regulator of arginine metabolism
MPTAEARRRALVQILEQGDAQSQAELLTALEQAGHASTQPVVSRDLRVIGAVKAEGRYSLPSEERVTPLQSLKALLRDAQLAGSHLVVVICEPGAASAIARALEAEADLPILGTVAGDDTVFVATATRADGVAIRRRVRELV